VEISSVCPDQLIETVPDGFAQAFGIFTFADIAGVTEFTWNGTETLVGFDLELLSDMASASFPNLVEVDPDGIHGGFIFIFNCSALTSLSFPNLIYVNGAFGVTQCNAMTSLSVPSLVACGDLHIYTNSLMESYSFDSLVTVTTGVFANDCPALTSVYFPNLLPTNGTAVDITNGALTAASVNHVLARGIANAGFVNGSILLNGGTSAAPSGQGIVDKADLILRGCTVTTN
jgi:hypothetical protein